MTTESAEHTEGEGSRSDGRSFFSVHSMPSVVVLSDAGNGGDNRSSPRIERAPAESPGAICEQREGLDLLTVVPTGV